jgi:hypothetical protein
MSTAWSKVTATFHNWIPLHSVVSTLPPGNTVAPVVDFVIVASEEHATQATNDPASAAHATNFEFKE